MAVRWFLSVMTDVEFFAVDRDRAATEENGNRRSTGV